MIIHIPQIPIPTVKTIHEYNTLYNTVIRNSCSFEERSLYPLDLKCFGNDYHINSFHEMKIFMKVLFHRINNYINNLNKKVNNE